jgi:hypothetical protein
MVCATAAMVRGAERATFILTDGQRMSGTVVFHTDARTNIRADKNEFNVGLADGTEVPIPFHQVVAIDFAGGRPGNRELQSLGAGHTLVMRDGAIHTGTLVDLVGGDTIRWRQRSGRVEEFPIRSASRIYLQADAARAQWQSDWPGRGGAARRSDDVSTPSADAGGVIVDANSMWTDTGIVVRRGEQVRFQATGRIRFREGIGQTANAAGNNTVRSPAFPVDDMGVGGLIARVGNGAPFPLGSGTSAVTMPASGRLQLGVNDDDYSDNSGAFRVDVLRRDASGAWVDAESRADESGLGSVWRRTRPDATSGASGTTRELRIAGSTAWTDTGLTVSRGESLSFDTSGSIAYRGGEWTDANGDPATRSYRYPLSNMPVGGLIARINGGRPFRIGAGSNVITMPASGRLELGINDDTHADNEGEYRVVIRSDEEGASWSDPWPGTYDSRGLLGEVVVSAASAWTTTSITVRRGDVLSFDTTGTVSFRPGNGNIVGPEGKNAVRSNRYPVPALPAGGLIGRVDGGVPFAIGAGRTVVMPASGRLQLGVNDDHFGDNSGAFQVQIRRGRQQ